MIPTKAEIDALRALLAKATPGPWAWGWRNDEITPGSIRQDDHTGRAVAMCPRYGKREFKNDAALIAALRNAAEHLLACEAALRECIEADAEMTRVLERTDTDGGKYLQPAMDRCAKAESAARALIGEE